MVRLLFLVLLCGGCADFRFGGSSPGGGGTHALTRDVISAEEMTCVKRAQAEHRDCVTACGVGEELRGCVDHCNRTYTNSSARCGSAEGRDASVAIADDEPATVEVYENGERVNPVAVKKKPKPEANQHSPSPAPGAWHLQ